MSTVYAWSELRKLVAIDLVLNELEVEYTQVRAKETEISALAAARKQEETTMQKSLRECRKLIDTIDTDIASLKELVLRKKRTLSNLTNPRECDALERELELHSQAIVRAENQLLDLWGERDEIEKKMSAVREQIATESARIENELSILKERHQMLSQKYASVQDTWDTCARDLPRELVAIYRHLKDSVDNPVVAIVGGQCGACFNLILPSDAAKLSSKSALQCPSCYRFICHPDALNAVRNESVAE